MEITDICTDKNIKTFPLDDTAYLMLFGLIPFNIRRRMKNLGGLENVYSRRLNVQHHMVYQVDVERKRIKILSLWTHYETF